MVGLLEGYELPSEIKTHAVFFKWNDLATKISVIQNDVLGFSVDVKNGKENGIIMQSMRNGCSVRGAVDEEIKLLRYNIQISELIHSYFIYGSIENNQFNKNIFQRVCFRLCQIATQPAHEIQREHQVSKIY